MQGLPMGQRNPDGTDAYPIGGGDRFVRFHPERVHAGDREALPRCALPDPDERQLL